METQQSFRLHRGFLGLSAQELPCWACCDTTGLPEEPIHVFRSSFSLFPWEQSGVPHSLSLLLCSGDSSLGHACPPGSSKPNNLAHSWVLTGKVKRKSVSQDGFLGAPFPKDQLKWSLNWFSMVTSGSTPHPQHPKLGRVGNLHLDSRH